MTYKFVKKYAHLLDWRKLPMNADLTFNLLNNERDKVHHLWIFENPNIPMNYIQEHYMGAVLAELSANPSLSFQFIEENLEYIDWNLLSLNPKMNSKFIRKYSQYLNWELNLGKPLGGLGELLLDPGQPLVVLLRGRGKLRLLLDNKLHRPFQIHDPQYSPIGEEGNHGEREGVGRGINGISRAI